MLEGCLMIKLDAGNVLLKPSHRKQLMSWLRRSLRLGSRIGNFVLQITLRRSGRHYDVRASVSDSAGTFDCHARQHDWRNALKTLVHDLSMKLHAQCLQRSVVVA